MATLSTHICGVPANAPLRQETAIPADATRIAGAATPAIAAAATSAQVFIQNSPSASAAPTDWTDWLESLKPLPKITKDTGCTIFFNAKERAIVEREKLVRKITDTNTPIEEAFEIAKNHDVLLAVFAVKRTDISTTRAYESAKLISDDTLRDDVFARLALSFNPFNPVEPADSVIHYSNFVSTLTSEIKDADRRQIVQESIGRLRLSYRKKLSIPIFYELQYGSSIFAPCTFRTVLEILDERIQGLTSPHPRVAHIANRERLYGTPETVLAVYERMAIFEAIDAIGLKKRIE